MKAIKKAEENKTDIPMQIWDLTIKDRTKRSCEFYMVPLGKVSLIIMNDITDRKKAESERQHLEKRLHQAQKMEAIGTLAGGIAHDFNNILSAVLGYAELAKIDAIAGEDITEKLDDVIKAGLRARDLVQHILTFSRKTDLKKSPVQLQSLIKEALKFVRASVPTTIEVQSNLEAPDSIIMADATQIHQVLMNLCTNASHAMKDKVGILSVEMGEVMIEAEQVVQYKEI
ncbi:MAG: PAS domain S-box protein, partial [Desulfobacterales bacterium]|nr:PAS domain S-box protein [Desulfobacterales bacterium]